MDAKPIVALVLSGGNALGAYHAGAYEALHRAGWLPDWVVGASAGAVNGALICGAPPEERVARLRAFWRPAPEEGADVFDDYATVGLSLRQHPMALIRPQLAKWRIKTAEELRTRAKDKQKVRASGIVTHRQRPSTANGVVFVTLEDETGTVNLIVWEQVADDPRVILLGAKMLSVEGTWQHEKGVQHLLVAKMVDHTKMLGALRVGSRDFR